MKHIEINTTLILSKSEENLVMMHSILNILNILCREIEQFGKLIKDEKLLYPAIEFLDVIKSHLDNEKLTYEHLDEIDKTRDFLTSSLVVAIESKPKIVQNPKAKYDIGNMVAILEHFKHKAMTYLEIKANPFVWKTFEITEIRGAIDRFFYVVAKNNRQNFGIVYNKDQQSTKDYLLLLDFTPPTGEVKIPAIMIDIMIDLLANARKYSKPGTTIKCSLRASDKSITLAVSDQGKGIPDKEITDVVGLHYRATNCLQKKTMGSGLGLTKAYFITKQLNGKFWIDSVLHNGTEVLIEIPIADNGS